jgi:outer membrane protein assembly factor BamB/tetratricopeptide (TPR) repeat protein
MRHRLAVALPAVLSWAAAAAGQGLPPRLPAGAPPPPAVQQAPGIQVFIQQDITGVQSWMEEARAAEARALAALKAGRPDEAQQAFKQAIEVLQDKVLKKVLQPDHRDIVVFRGDFRSKSSPAVSARYVPAVRAVREMIAAWPKEGREFYRELYEARAGIALRKALGSGRPDELLAVADQYGNTAAGLRALELSADLMADAGRFGAAAEVYRELLGRPGGAGDQAGLLTAKLAVCAAGAGRPELAAVELAPALADPAGGPKVEVRGRPVALAEFAGPLLASAEQARDRARDAGVWTCFGGAGSHDRPAAGLTGPLVRDGIARPGNLMGEMLMREGRPAFGRSSISQERVVHNPFLPAFRGQLMILQTENDLVVYDLSRDCRTVAQASDIEPDGPDRTEPPFGSNRVPGNDRFVTVSGDRVFVKVGRPPRTEARFRFGNPAETPATIALKAFDLKIETREGRTAVEIAEAPWKPTAVTREDDEFLKSGYFLTVPVPGEGGRMFAGFARKNEHWLVCLDAGDGRVLWRTFVAQGNTYQATQMAVAQVEGTPPAVDGGSVYWCTNAGAIAAVSAGTGRVRWVAVYENQRLLGTSVNPDTFYPWRNCPPVVHDGWLAAAPLDDNNVIFVNTADGTPVRNETWRPWRERPRYLVGAARTVDPVSGRRVPAVFLLANKVYAVDPRRQKVLWVADFRDPGGGESVVGRPALTEDMLLVPTRSGLAALDLTRPLRMPDEPGNDGDLDAARERETRRQLEIDLGLPTDFPAHAGNLAVHEGRLIAVVDASIPPATAREGMVYVAKSQVVVLEELSRRETGDPKKLGRLLKDGADALAAGRFDPAADALVEAARLLAGKGASVGQVLSRLAADLLALGEKLPARRAELYGLAGRIAPEGPLQAAALWRQADVLAAGGDSTGAIKALQGVVALAADARLDGADALAEVGGGVKADLPTVARERIRRLAADNAAGYEPFAKEAADRLAASRGKAEFSPADCWQIYLRYPAAPAAAEALLDRARWKWARKDNVISPTALGDLRLVRRDWPGSPAALAAADLELRLLDEMGRRREALELITALVSASPQAVLRAGKTVEQVARDLSARPEYAPLRAGLGIGDRPPAVVTGIVEKPEWRIDLPAGRVLMPAGDAPPFLVFLADNEGVQARHRGDGNPVWKAPVPMAVGGTQAAGRPRPRVDAGVYDGRLFVGFPASAAALDVRTGKRIWAEAEGAAGGRGFAETDRTPPPADVASRRVLRLWGVCDGTAFGPDAAVRQRFSNDLAEPRLTVFRPAAADADAIKVHTVSDARPMMGAPLLAGGRMIGLTRYFGVRIYGLADGRPERPDADIPGEAPFAGPPLLSDDGECLLVCAGGRVTAWTLRPSIYGAGGGPRPMWTRDFGDRRPELVSAAGDRVVLLFPDGECLALDLRTASDVWSVRGVASEKGPLLDCPAVPGGKTLALVFGHDRLRPEPGRRFDGFEVLWLDPATGKIAHRSALDFPEAEDSRPAGWMTALTAGGRLILSAAADAKPADGNAEPGRRLRVWVLTPGETPTVAARTFALADAPLTDNQIGVVGGQLLVSDGRTVAAYTLTMK